MQAYKKWVLRTYGSSPISQVPYGASLATLKFTYFTAPISYGGSAISKAVVHLDLAGRMRHFGAYTHSGAMKRAKLYRERAHLQYNHRLP